MFEAKLGSASLLKRIVDAIKDFVSDAPFDCNSSAMCLQAMDSSHVALVSLKLDIGIFESYRCDRNIYLGISLANMAKALKCANNEDTCMIRYEENDGDSMMFAFEDVKRGKKQEINVRMMDIDREHIGIPEQDYLAVVVMASTEFQKTCRDLSLFSDTLHITATKGSVVFTGKGDTGSSVVTYEPTADGDADENEAVTIEVSKKVSIVLSLEYVKHFTKATGLSQKVRLCMSDDLPMLVEYSLEDNSFLRFYLAPKIDDGDGGME